MTDAPTASMGWPPVRYCVETDTMLVQIGPWPGQEDDDGVARDADVDLIIHYAPDRQHWLGKLSTSRSIRSMLRPRWQSCVGRAPLRGEAVASVRAANAL
jgi:hypothetical protein